MLDFSDMEIEKVKADADDHELFGIEKSVDKEIIYSDTLKRRRIFLSNIKKI